MLNEFIIYKEFGFIYENATILARQKKDKFKNTLNSCTNPQLKS
jgi:hypothetical protein